MAPKSTGGLGTPAFWKTEAERAETVSKTHHPAWQENIDYYSGISADAAKATERNADWVNVNVDFYQAELKGSQLFYDTPELQLSARGPFKPMNPQPGQQPPLPAVAIIQAHRELLDELLGPDHADVLTTVQKCIKDCLVPSGFGASKIGYQSTTKDTQPPEQLGAVLGLNAPISVPLDEKWYWNHIPAKKVLIPADFKDTTHENAPWLGHKFRMPTSVAKRLFNLPDTITGTSDQDESTFKDGTQSSEASGVPYIDGIEIWYRAALFDDDVIHPELFRQHVLVDSVDGFVEKNNASPNQEIGPDGRLTADSMRGNPIHILTLRDVPDSAYPPSDCSMTRPLVRELCKFRTQMVQERDANKPRTLVDGSKLTPAELDKVTNGTTGDLILVGPDVLAQGVGTVMAQVVQGTSPRQTYIANDYITGDIQKTLGLNANQAAQTEKADTSATEIAIIDRQANVRIDAERRRVLQWYLKGVAKYSALVCRFMTPALAVPYVGEQSAQVWGSWNKKVLDGRMVFNAKPDSQIHLDAAAERKSWMQLYQFSAKDPNVIRIALLKKLFELHGEDPSQYVVDQLPGKPHDEGITFSFHGEDLYNPMVREILAQGGIQISQQTIDDAASQLFKQVSAGVRDASGKAIPAAQRPPAEHGGPVEQVRPLSQQQGDQSGDRSGAPNAIGIQ